MRSLIRSARLVSWEWKPAMSRIVFWFKYVLKVRWNRGQVVIGEPLVQSR